MIPKKKDKPCDVCGRSPGPAPLDRTGQPDPNPETELGPTGPCANCGCIACPDCWHERDCCAGRVKLLLDAAEKLALTFGQQVQVTRAQCEAVGFTDVEHAGCGLPQGVKRSIDARPVTLAMLQKLYPPEKGPDLKLFDESSERPTADAVVGSKKKGKRRK